MPDDISRRKRFIDIFVRLEVIDDAPADAGVPYPPNRRVRLI